MKKNDPLTKAVDMLFTIALFYALVQWVYLESWQSKALWVSLILIILNEQVSVRASYDVYNIFIYMLDLVSLFLYIIALKALLADNPIFGYEPSFWIAVGFLWLFYAIWDYVMMPFADDNAKKNLRKWAANMIFAFILTLISYGVMIFFPLYFNGLVLSYGLIAAQVLAFVIILWALYLWNKDRLTRAMEVINEAKGNKEF